MDSKKYHQVEEIVTKKYFDDLKLPKHKRLPENNFIDWALFGASEMLKLIKEEEEVNKVKDNENRSK